MKWFRLFVIVSVLVVMLSSLSLASHGDAEIDEEQCSYKGIPLHGEVQFVNSSPDFEVKFVKHFPDLEVKFVENFPNRCGEWEIVNSSPDFTIKPVNHFPDLEVKVVESFPGIP